MMKSKHLLCIWMMFALGLVAGCDSGSSLSGDLLDTALTEDDQNVAVVIPEIGTPLDGAARSVNMSLVGNGFDMELDTVRQRLYVSVPDLNRIVVIDSSTLAVVDNVVIPDRPQGIDMSPDGNTLAVALFDSGTVGLVDLNSLAVTQVSVAVEMESSLVYDVIHHTNDLVFASGAPGSSGFAKVVQIDRANANLVSVVASNRIIRANPFFAASAASQFIYVGETFSPNSVYKLDLNQANAPIVLEDAHGSISGARHFDVSPDDTRLLLSSGEILDTATLTQSAAIGEGISIFSSDGTTAIVADTVDVLGLELVVINIYDLATTQVTATHISSCAIEDVERVLEVQAGTDWFVMGESTVCQVTAPTDPLTSTIDLVIETVELGDPVAGSEFSYQLNITNQGSVAAALVEVQNILPPGSVFDRASGTFWDCAEAAGTVTCTADEVAIGLGNPITIDLTLPGAAGTATNTATITSAYSDEDTSNNSSTTNTAVVSAGGTTSLGLGAAVFDIELDTPRQRLYVSVPTLNSVEVISLATFTVVNSIPVGSSPHGMDISLDGSTLYVALNEGGAVSVVDLDTFGVSTVNVATELENSNVYDVIAATADLVLVSGNPSTSSSKVIQIDTANANAITVIAGNNIIDADPFFGQSPGSQFVYLTNGNSPNSVFQLDLNQANVPITLEDDHGSIESGSNEHIALNATDSRIYTASGQILDTATLTQSGFIADGIAVPSSDGNNILVEIAPNTLALFDRTTLLETSRVYSTCTITDIVRIVEIQANMTWVLLGDQAACQLTAP